MQFLSWQYAVLFVEILCIIHNFICINFVGATLSKSDKKSSRQSTSTKKPQAKSASHFAPFANSNQPDLTYESILASHNLMASNDTKRFPNPILAYITPWNNRGYDMAKIVGQKFTHISPVWFQINYDEDGCTIAGTHDIDQEWVEKVRESNSNVKIVPRFLFDKWTTAQLSSFLSNSVEQEACFRMVTQFVKRNRFDGIVVEIWTRVVSSSQSFDIKKSLSFTIINFAEQLKASDKEFVLVVPPLHPGTEIQMFTGDDFESLLQYVDLFSVMTYDYPANPPAGIAPLPWINECFTDLISVDENARAKLLMGLNFYGYDYSKSGVNPIVGKGYVDLLKQHKPKLVWNDRTFEHVIQYADHVLFYPTIASLGWRVNLAKELGVGLAIWEAGQGLDYFTQLF